MGHRTVSLCGFYRHQNFGDEVLGAALSAALLRAGASSVRLFSDKTEGDVLDGRGGAHLDGDVVAIGGGGLVAPDFWALRPGPLAALRESGKPVCFLNVNVTPAAMEDAPFVASLRALGAVWWVRDRFSVDALRAEGMDARWLPDVVLGLAAEPRPRKRQAVVFLNDYPLSEDLRGSATRFIRAMGTLQGVAQHLDWLAHWGWSSVLCPLHTAVGCDDRRPAATVSSLCAEPMAHTWLTAPPAPHEVLELVAESSLVISMRYHGTIAALAAGTPCVDITHHPKNAQLIAELGLEGIAVPYGAASPDALVRATQAAEGADEERDARLDAFKRVAHRRWEEFAVEWAQFAIGAEDV